MDQKPERPDDNENVDVDGETNKTKVASGFSGEDIQEVRCCLCHHWWQDDDSNDFDHIIDQADHGHNDPWHDQTGFCLATNQSQSKGRLVCSNYLPGTMNEQGCDDNFDNA